MCRGGAFCGILLLSGLTQWLEPVFNLPLLYASFGASAVLVFGVISSPLAQPRNFIGKLRHLFFCARVPSSGITLLFVMLRVPVIMKVWVRPETTLCRIENTNITQKRCL
jgi:hypothetical protein